MVRINSFFRLFLILLITGVLFGCSGQSDNKADKPETAAVDDLTQGDPDKQAIKDMLEEAIERLRYGDKGGLYDNEFDFVKEKYTFDEYLQHLYIKTATGDSVTSFDILDIKLLDGDSARIRDRVVFVGVQGDTSVMHNEYSVYYENGRWIKPTIGFKTGQILQEK
ncbi:MAG: hypothetical protein JXA92_05290 [candidate division Zixibacteria bacterium]|nr:hypothetical protein [candidate division Zixibacteria bacterium]